MLDASQMGKKGGKERARRLTAERRREIAAMGAFAAKVARAKNPPKNGRRKKRQKKRTSAKEELR